MFLRQSCHTLSSQHIQGGIQLQPGFTGLDDILHKAVASRLKRTGLLVLVFRDQLRLSAVGLEEPFNLSLHSITAAVVGFKAEMEAVGQA